MSDKPTFTPSPGWFPGIPFPTYLKIDAISSHGLMDARISAAHWDVRRKLPDDPTPSMMRGKRLHSAVLEPWDFVQRYRVMPEFWGFTKQGERTNSANATDVKAQKQAWLEAQPENAIIMDQEEADQTAGMCQALLDHSIAGPLLRAGQCEISGFVECPRTGLLRKVRCDNLQPDYVIDYKTCGDLEEAETFWKDAYNYKYDMQAWWYQDTSFLIDKMKREFLFIAQEDKPPYGIRTYVADTAFLEKGRLRCLTGLKKIEVAVKTKKFDSYPEVILNLGLPNYAYYQGESELEEHG